MATPQRVSTLDLGYQPGQLSLFPLAIDTQQQLYRATNNAETQLKQTLTFSGKYIVVENNDAFPPNGLLRIGPPAGQAGNSELVYYDQKVKNVFRNLIRGFAGSRQGQWSAGSAVVNSVMAEHHNSIKDAVFQIEADLGTEDNPTDASLNGILKAQELRFLSPKPLFRAFPTIGPPPLRVHFQNFSTGPLVRFLWDFGDGSTSVEKSPTHTYLADGKYSVKLNIITSLGGQGIQTKNNYITVDDQERIPFFYVTPKTGLSKQTADLLGVEPTVFRFVDQTDGDIFQRYWIFDGSGTSDGVTVTNQSLPVHDGNIHTANYIYDKPGSPAPTLLVLYANQSLKRAFLKEIITVE